MQDDTSQIVASLTRDLERNPEVRLAAENLLRETIVGSGASAGGLAAMALELRNRQSRHIPAHWRFWLYGLVLVLVLAVSVPFAWEAAECALVLRSRSMTSVLAGGTQPYHPHFIRNLPAKDRLLLLGDESAEDDAGKWRPLWQSDPDNPAFLLCYAYGYIRAHHTPSQEILDAIARVDPNNACYPLLQAASDAGKTINIKSATPAERKKGSRGEWEIRNINDFNRRMELIHKGASMPTLRGYHREMMRHRAGLFPPAHDCFSAVSGKLVYGAGEDFFFIGIGKCADLLAAGARECEKNRDIEGFQTIVADWKSICRMMARDGEWLVDGLITQHMLSKPLEDFRDAAHGLGLEKDAAHFESLFQTIQKEKEAKKQQSKTGETKRLADRINLKGSVIASTSILALMSPIQSPPAISDEEMTPGRYADHALLGRCVSFAMIFMFGLLAGVAALCRYRQSAAVNGISRQLTGLLRLSDVGWICGLGLLWPVIWFFAIGYGSPFSAREWSLRLTGIYLSLGQFAALFLMWLTLTLATTGWRLGKRGACLGLRGRQPWLTWFMAGFLMLAIPAIGSVTWIPALATERGLFWVMGVFLGIPLLWLAWVLIHNLLNPPSSIPRNPVLARCMVPAWLGAAALCACLMPVFHQLEAHWLARDRLVDVTNPSTVYCRYEMEVARLLRQELTERMDKWF